MLHMGFKIRGNIHAIFDARQITERFRKREFVLELAQNPNYPQYVIFQLTGDRCDKLDSFDVGEEVQVEFSLRGREWTSPQDEVKYFNSLDVWALEHVLGASHSPDSREGEPPRDESPSPSDEDIQF